MYMCILTAVDHPTSASDVAAQVEDGLESTLYVSLGRKSESASFGETLKECSIKLMKAGTITDRTVQNSK